MSSFLLVRRPLNFIMLLNFIFGRVGQLNHFKFRTWITHELLNRLLNECRWRPSFIIYISKYGLLIFIHFANFWKFLNWICHNVIQDYMWHPFTCSVPVSTTQELTIYRIFICTFHIYPMVYFNFDLYFLVWLFDVILISRGYFFPLSNDSLQMNNHLVYNYFVLDFNIHQLLSSNIGHFGPHTSLQAMSTSMYVASWNQTYQLTRRVFGRGWRPRLLLSYSTERNLQFAWPDFYYIYI